MPYLNRDGVALFYEQTGSGDPPLLFVHGWCCDHTYFAPQVEHFSRSHRVVAVDLRGHGQSDKPEQDYTMAGFAGDLAWLCGELKLAKPVVIGHSMGGVIAVQLAARYPALPAALVLVDSPILNSPERIAAALPLIEALRGPGYLEAARGFVAGRLFLPTDDAEVKARTVAAMSSAPQYVMASAYADMIATDGERAVQACMVSVLNLRATFPPYDLTQLRQLCPDWIYGQTVGAGHFHQLIVPEQVNLMIERFLQLYIPQPVRV